MRFELPNAVAAMNNAVAAAGDDDGDAWEIVGEPLDRQVDEVLPAYDRAFELNLDPSGGDKRLEVCGLNWGRIGKDVARLNGLAAAIDDIAGVVKAGKDQLAHDWRGEAYDAFRAAVEKVEKTLGDYSAAVKATAAGLETALTGIRTAYTTYRDDTRQTHLNFSEVAPPADWWKMSHDSGEFLAERCTSYHGGVVMGAVDRNCCYNDDEQLAIIDGRFVNNRLFDRLESWDCTDDAGVVIDQYRTTVDAARDEKDLIVRKIHNWYQATDQLKDTVDLLFREALANLRVIAEVRPFATLSVPGADVDAGSSGGGSADGDQSGEGPEAVAPPPADQPAVDPPAVDPPAVDPPAVDPPAAEVARPETVEIRDADRTIVVSSPDGEGHIAVTVEDASGRTKSYDLDFNTASGIDPAPAGGGRQPREPDVEHVPAGSNGKCAITDGPVTITAERSLFDDSVVTLTVDDGTAKPTTYRLDFTVPEDLAGQAPPPDRAPAAEGTEPSPAAAKDPAAAEKPNAPEPEKASSPDGSPARGEVGAEEPATRAEPVQPPATDDAQPPPKPEANGSAAEPDVRAGAATASPASGAAEPSSVPAPGATEPSSARASGAAESSSAPAEGAGEPAVAGETAPAVSGAAADAPTSSTDGTGTRDWRDDRGGTLSGILVPEQPDGEAGLASAGAGEPAGAAGGGVPMMAGASGGNDAEAGRAGTGWSVHGDLFDSSDPVYSVHGVLGEDDLRSQ